MRSTNSSVLGPRILLLAAAFSPSMAHAAAADFPLARGTSIVIAVSNSADPAKSASIKNVAQNDYEVLVSINDFGKDGITHSAYIDAEDDAGVRRQATIRRKVRTADIATSHLQVLGFKSSDPEVVPGTTSLGPSTAVLHELLAAGHTEYSFKNFTSQPAISGRLDMDRLTVKFPILLNGVRVEVPAIRTTGQMSSGSSMRPFEQLILDYPGHPLSLRIAYGPRNGSIPFKPEFAREMVRVDFPVPDDRVAKALESGCRTEVPGIYFDFNEATIKAPSKPALEHIAGLLRTRANWHVVIEGHTDNIGTDAYNDDLSTRRAAAVKAELQRTYGVDASQLASAGFGSRKPIDSNATMAGRARNRRVEISRDCPGH